MNSGDIDTSYDVDMYDVDLFDTPQSKIEVLSTKEQVATFASVMFVIISLMMFIWMTIKENKNK